MSFAMKFGLPLIILATIFEGLWCDDVPCAGRQMEYGTVCVCNSSYCDTVSRPSPLPRGQYYHYTTGQDSPGFTHTTGNFTDQPHLTSNTIVFTVNRSTRYQEIVGIGGSFTDSSGIAVTSLPVEAQSHFIQSYFSENGIEYSMGRVPIAASDFSTRYYTYDDVPNDKDLKHFSLTEEDYKYKIPLIRAALNVTPHELKLVGCSFTAPSWMKTSNASFSGYILTEYLTSWANYHIKFFDAYADNGIKFYTFTGGNEVQFPFVIGGSFSIGTVAWPINHRQWLKYHLAPLLRVSNHSHVKLVLLDDMRIFAQYWMDRFTADPADSDLVEGVGLHWYWDWMTPATVLDKFHERFPDKLILYTESSINTFLFGGVPVELGSWNRGAFYIYNIIENLNHWTAGYLDWNLALDTEGGPYLQLAIDAPIIVNKSTGEFYKNPMFYCIGHFSKFIAPGSRRVHVDSNLNQTSRPTSEQFREETISRLFAMKENTNSQENFAKVFDDHTTPKPGVLPTFPPFPAVVVPSTVSCLATVDSDKRTTVVVFNSMNSAVNVTINDVTAGSITATFPAQSVHTFVYWPDNS